MKSAWMAVQESSKTLRSMPPGVWPAIWYLLNAPPDVTGVFRESVLSFGPTLSAAC